MQFLFSDQGWQSCGGQVRGGGGGVRGSYDILDRETPFDNGYRQEVCVVEDYLVCYFWGTLEVILMLRRAHVTVGRGMGVCGGVKQLMHSRLLCGKVHKHNRIMAQTLLLLLAHDELCSIRSSLEW